MRVAAFLLCVLPVACGPGLPDLQMELSDEARASAFPELIPLGPLLAEVDAPLRRTAEDEGLSLEARAERLRRRAAWLSQMQL